MLTIMNYIYAIYLKVLLIVSCQNTCCKLLQLLGARLEEDNNVGGGRDKDENDGGPLGHQVAGGRRFGGLPDHFLG